MIIQAIKNIKFNTYTQQKPNKGSFGLRLSPLNSDKFERNISFQGFPCSQERFELKNLENIPCPSCGKTMIQNSELRRFINKASVQTGDELIKTLEEYSNLYRLIEAQAVGEITKLAKKYPESDLPQLVKIAKASHLSKLVKEQVKILDRIERMGQNLDKDEMVQLTNLTHVAKRFAKMTGNDDGDHFGRKRFLEQLYLLTEQFDNKKLVKQIRDTAQTLPSSTNSLSAFFVKYSRETAEKIATRLLSPMVVTTEHIRPVSLGGEDNTANYLVECMDCNSKRGNMPYEEWFKIQPKMPENLQRYIEVIDEIIRKYNIKGYENYIQDIIKTIDEETDGSLKLDSPITIEDIGEDVQDPIQARREKIAKITELLEESNTRMRELDKKREDFDNDPEYQNILRYIYLQEREDETKKKRISTSKELSALRHEQQAQQNRKGRLETLQHQLQKKEPEGLSRKEIDDLKHKIFKLQEKIGKDEDLTPKIEQAQKEYDEASAEFNATRAELAELRKTFKLPEDYLEQEMKIQAQIQERLEIEKEIKKYDSMLEEKKELSSQIGTLKEELEALKEENEKIKEGLDFNSPESIAIKQEYEKLKCQYDILNNANLNLSILCATDANAKGISLDFIAQKAKERIEEEIEEIGQTPLGEYLVTKGKIKELEDMIIEKEIELDNIPKFMSRRKALMAQIAQLNKEKSIQELSRELEKVISERQALQEKFRYANIENERNIIIARINELTELLGVLLKQGE